MECRICNSTNTKMVFSLGEMPLANSLLSKPDEPYKKYPLELVLCKNCSAVQLSKTIIPSEMFCDYSYLTSYSIPMVAHAAELVSDVLVSEQLGKESLVVEIGSNDGYLLQHYVHKGIPVLGIDPSDRAAIEAEKRGVPTVREFFSSRISMKIDKKADVIHANNVLAHVPYVTDFVAGLANLLKDDGVLIVEVPYVCRMIDKTAFDTVYHEHVYYFSVTALQGLFKRYGMKINRTQEISTHGGSLRLWIGKVGHEDRNTLSLLSQESFFIRSEGYYKDFSVRAEKIRFDIRKLLEGKRIAGFGAAAKATIFLNSVGITSAQMGCVTDETPTKQGKFIPGTGIPVVPVAQWLEGNYDATMVLAWNFGHAIAHKYRHDYRGKWFTYHNPELLEA